MNSYLQTRIIAYENGLNENNPVGNFSSIVTNNYYVDSISHSLIEDKDNFFKDKNMFVRVDDATVNEFMKNKERLDAIFNEQIKTISNWKFINELIRESTASYLKWSNNIVDVKKGYFEEEYDVFIFYRDMIHNLIRFSKENDIEINKAVIDEIKSADSTVIVLAKKELPKYRTQNAFLYTRKIWWHYLNEINNLTKEELSTL